MVITASKWLRNRVVRWTTDAMVAVQAWTKQKSKHHASNRLLAALGHHCTANAIVIDSRWWPREDNHLADSSTHANMCRHCRLRRVSPCEQMRVPQRARNRVVVSHPLIGNFNGSYVTHPGIPPVAPDGITERLNALLSESYAINAIKSYNSKMMLFLTFLARCSLMVTEWNGANPTVPIVTPATMMFFCTFMLMKGFNSAGSVAGCCTASKQWCLLHDRPDPTINSRTQQVDIRHARLHRAIKRQLGTKSSQREPLSLLGLRLILAVIRSDFLVPPTMIPNFVAAILLGFHGMLRVSEFTNLTTLQHDIGREACRGDVKFFGPSNNPDGFRFTVKMSKTNQFRVTQTITVFASPDPKLCPVRAMHALFTTDPRTPSSPLFDFTSRSTNAPGRNVIAARSRFMSAFQRAIVSAGLFTTIIQTHSLRSGGATACLQAGIEPYIIQRMGRWQSWCFAIRTWTSTSHIQDAMARLAAVPTDTQHINPDSVRVDLDTVRW